MPIAYVEHQIPGRLRLRIPERRGDVAFFQRVVGALSKVPDVTELDGSPLTGSVRIRYSGTAEAIAAAAAKEGLFEICKRDGEAQPKKPPKEPASPGAPHGDAGMLDSIATGLVRTGAVSSHAGPSYRQRRREFLERLRGATPPGPQRDCGGVCASGALSAAARTMAWLGILAFFLCAGGPPARRARSGRGCNDWPERVAALGKRAAEAPTKEANSRQAK